MNLKFTELGVFIEKYCKLFYKDRLEINFYNNTINIYFIDYKNIKIGIHISNKFKYDNNFINIKNKNIKNYLIKLLDLLNKNVEIPTSVQMGKIINNLKDKSIFLLSITGNIGDLSKDIIKILNISKNIYTNNKKGIKIIFRKLNIINNNIHNFGDLNVYDNDLTLVNYGDFLEGNKEINIILSKYYDKFNNIYILANSTNFINKYSLSHTNYGSLLYLGLYFKRYNNIIKKKVLSYLHLDYKIQSKFSIGKMISLSGLSLEFLNYLDLNNFLNSIKNFGFNQKFLIEIIHEVDDGYYNIVDYIEEIEFNYLKNKKNVSNITIFIYPKVINFFIGYKKFNLYNSPKKITYISSPLSNITEFTNNSIAELKKSKYIYGESISGTKVFLKNLKITYNDKEILYGEDIEGINNFIKENKLYNKNKINLVKNVFPELIKKLDNSQQIHFLTDGGAPCILDPGDSIKKYINLYYPEYSIIGIKGPNVISTVLLSCIFKYKYIYWTSLIYTIYPVKRRLEEINFFSKRLFKDTLIIFYSFGKHLDKDILILIDLFGKDTKIQVVGDIGKKQEFNKIFKLGYIKKIDVNYIMDKIENIVYLLQV